MKYMHFKINQLFSAILLSFSFLVISCNNDTAGNQAEDNDIKKVNHVVVIYLENHSFDNLYGQFAGVNGLANATAENKTQVDKMGVPYTTLPDVPGTTNFPQNLSNAPFNIDQYVPTSGFIPDLIHRFYTNQQQINGGKNNKFVTWCDSKALSMGYYTTANLPVAIEAKNYTLCDNFFQSAFGGSFLNHQFLIAAAPPKFPNAPNSLIATFDANGVVIKDGAVSPNGYGINTLQTVNTPHNAGTSAANLIPNQNNPTIGDRLSDKNISWAWYAGGWDNALAGNPDPLFQFHHQPFVYYANYADGTQAKKDHLKDEAEFITALNNGSLPSVSFVKPLGNENEHPGYANVSSGEYHTISLINAIKNSSVWKDTVIIITYDENGGFWDHVAPPVIDKWGPGTRVPTIIISPFAKKNYIDHTPYETLSILAFIEKRWDLAALTTRDKNANPLSGAFQF